MRGASKTPRSRCVELSLLTETAGAEPVHVTLQRRPTPDPATYVGKGKAEELRELSEALDIDVVVFDDELTPAQQRNLEKLFARDVVDRVALILDIFAQHATSQEGMVQVELAQLRYRLPRLRGRGVQLSQQGAGIGTRGPGETQLEVDRRRILRRVQQLERDLKTLAKTRQTQRKARVRQGLARDRARRLHERRQVDAAQSAHALRRARRRPAVLDARPDDPPAAPARRRDRARLRHRRVRAAAAAPAGRGLPVHARRGGRRRPAAPRRRREPARGRGPHRGGARGAHRDRRAAIIPSSWCGTSATSPTPTTSTTLLASFRGSVAVSGATGDGVDELRLTIADRLRALDRLVELVVPYDRGDVLAALHRDGEVLVEVHDEGGTRVRARLSDAVLARFRGFVTAEV